MLPVNREYYIIWDRIARNPYLAWKQDGEFWTQIYCGDIKNDRHIVSSIPVILPNSKNANGWILTNKEKPFVKDMYETSLEVLTFDSRKNFICECFLTIGDHGSEWVDSESGASYDKTNFDPDYWKPIPTIEQMESLIKELKSVLF